MAQNGDAKFQTMTIKITKKKEDVEWLIQTIKKYQDSGEDWKE